MLNKGVKKEDKGRNWQTKAIAVVLLMGVLLYLWFLVTIKEEDERFDNEPAYKLEEGWVAESSGKRVEGSLPVHLDVQPGETVVFRRVLEAQPTFANTILFRSIHQDVEIFLEDQLLLTYGDNQITPIEMFPGSLWHCIRLPQDWVGKELVIKLTSTYDFSAGFLEEVYIGSKSALLFTVLRKGMLSILINMPIFLAGIVMVITGVLIRERLAVRKLTCLGLFAIVTSGWIMLDSRMTQFFTGKILVYMNMIFVLFPLVPVLIIYYLLSYRIFARSQYMRGAFGASILNFILIQVLNLFGIVDYLHSLTLVHVLLIFVLAGIVGVYVRAIKEKQELETEVKHLFNALFIFGGFGILDVIYFYVAYKDTYTPFFTQIGLLCFILLLGYSVIRMEMQESQRKAEQKTLERLAYTDMLTGLKNRTAFEAKMDGYRKGERKAHPIIMVTDMNNLKLINDTYGHSEGDRAIITVARALEEYFADGGECYRIGGDEFCVIAENASEEEFAQRIELYGREISNNEESGLFELSVACGFMKSGSDGVDRAFTEADHKMYRCKDQMKKNKAK